MRAQPALGRLSRRAIRRGAAVALMTGAAALAALAIMVGNGDSPIRTLTMVDPAYLAVAGALTLGSWWLRVARNQLLLAALGRPVGTGRMLRYFLASAFVSHVTPTSTGGVPVFVYLLTREGLTAGQAAAVAVIDSGLVAVWLLAGWPVALALEGLLGPATGAGLTAAVLGALALVSGLLLWSLARPRGLAALLLRVGRAAQRSCGPGQRPGVRRAFLRLARETLRFGRALRFFVLKRPWTLAGAVVLTGIYWAGYLSIAWAVVRGLGGRPDWTPLALRQLAFNLAQVFIPTPGGSGGAELLMGYLLRGFVPASRLAVAVAVWRLYTFYASLAVGGVLLLRTLRLALNDGGGGPAPSPSVVQAGRLGWEAEVANEARLSGRGDGQWAPSPARGGGPGRWPETDRSRRRSR